MRKLILLRSVIKFSITIVLAASGMRIASMAAPADKSALAVITGKVSSADGKALAGVTVASRNVQRNIVEATFTGADGSYRLAVEFPGSLEISTKRLGFRQAKEKVQLSAGQSHACDFVLQNEDDISEQASLSSLLEFLPDGWAKREFIFYFANRMPINRKGLLGENRLDLARRIAQQINGWERGGQLIEPYVRPQVYADWLLRYLGPETKNVKMKIPPQPGAELAGAKIIDIPLPHPDDSNHDSFVDEEGMVWTTIQNRGVLYKLNPATAQYETIPVPVKDRDPLLVRGIYPARDGVTWWILMGSGRAIAFNHKTREFGKILDFEQYGRFYPHTVGIDKDDNIWVADNYGLYPGRGCKMDTKTGEMTVINFPDYPGPYLHKVPQGYGLWIAPNDHIWITLVMGNRFIEIDPATMKQAVREMPSPHSGPRRIWGDPEGNLWIPEYSTNKLAKFEPKTEKFKEYSLPTPDSGPYTVRRNPRTGDLWIACGFSDNIVRFNPKTEKFTEYPVPVGRAFMRHVSFHPTKNELWVTVVGGRFASMIRLDY